MEAEALPYICTEDETAKYGSVDEGCTPVAKTIGLITNTLSSCLAGKMQEVAFRN